MNGIFQPKNPERNERKNKVRCPSCRKRTTISNSKDRCEHCSTLICPSCLNHIEHNYLPFRDGSGVPYYQCPHCGHEGRV